MTRDITVIFFAIGFITLVVGIHLTYSTFTSFSRLVSLNAIVVEVKWETETNDGKTYLMGTCVYEFLDIKGSGVTVRMPDKVSYSSPPYKIGTWSREDAFTTSP